MSAQAPSLARPCDLDGELDRAKASPALAAIVIPPCPTLLARLQQALAQSEPDLAAVADIAGHDVAMSATLIARANAPAFAAAFPGTAGVTTVGQAMNRLGLAETARAMTAFALQRALPLPAAPSQPALQRFWERSRRRALALDFIARQLPGMSPDLAHTTGLFCHVGLPVLLQCLRGYGGTLMEAEARRDRSAIATENANHRTDHAVVGALVCRVWRLAPEVVAAVRLHHDLGCLADESVGAEVRTLVAAALVADQLVRQAEGLQPDRDWQQHAPAALAWLHIGPAEVEAWDEALDPVFAAA